MSKIGDWKIDVNRAKQTFIAAIHRRAESLGNIRSDFGASSGGGGTVAASAAAVPVIDNAAKPKKVLFCVCLRGSFAPRANASLIFNGACGGLD